MKRLFWPVALTRDPTLPATHRRLGNKAIHTDVIVILAQHTALRAEGMMLDIN